MIIVIIAMEEIKIRIESIIFIRNVPLIEITHNQAIRNINSNI